MYSDAGPKTCLGLPGSRGNEELDAQFFADLGVDFLKYDNCAAGPEDWIVDRYTAMGDALNATGRPILYSMCNWGVGDSWLWGPKVNPTPCTTNHSCICVFTDGWREMHACLLSRQTWCTLLHTLFGFKGLLHTSHAHICRMHILLHIA